MQTFVSVFQLLSTVELNKSQSPALFLQISNEINIKCIQQIIQLANIQNKDKTRWVQSLPIFTFHSRTLRAYENNLPSCSINRCMCGWKRMRLQLYKMRAPHRIQKPKIYGSVAHKCWAASIYLSIQYIHHESAFKRLHNRQIYTRLNSTRM